MDKEEIKAVSGSSIGLLSAYALSANKHDLLEHMFRSVDIGKGLRLFGEVFFHRLLQKEIDAFVSLDDELKIPLAFPICYIPLYNVKYHWLLGRYNVGWLKYFYAAINYPFLCIAPSVLEHRLAIDGGAADNIPIFPLLKMSDQLLHGEKFDLIIVLHFDARYDYRKDFDTDIPVLELDVSICNNFKKDHYNFSTQSVDEMICKGEEYGEAILTRLFEGDCSKEALQKKIDAIFLEEHAVRQKNLSIDRAFSMLNLIGKFLRNDSDCNRRLY